MPNAGRPSRTPRRRRGRALGTEVEDLPCDAQVDQRYREPDSWFRSAVLNTARMGYFSSDRTVREYAEKVWGTKSLDRIVRD